MDVQGWQLNKSFPCDASNHNAKLSGLESLPAEILEPIFLGSCNGNLLLAAPRMAAKLHSQVVYRAAFLIAFYSYQLEETATVLGIHNLESFIQQPPQAWDIRSMTKAVLGSRWCTCGWTRDFLFSLFASVVQNSRTMLGSSDVFADDRLARRKSLQVYAENIDRRRNASAGTSSHSPLSVDHFNIVLELLDLPEVDINDVRDAADDTDMNGTDMNYTDMTDTDMTDDTDPSDTTDAGDTTGVSDPDYVASADYWRYDNRYFALDQSAFRQLR